MASASNYKYGIQQDKKNLKLLQDPTIDHPQQHLLSLIQPGRTVSEMLRDGSKISGIMAKKMQS